MSRNWKSYRHRFIPWLALNWSTRQVKWADSQLSVVKEERALSQLRTLLGTLSEETPHFSPKKYKQLLRSSSELQRLAQSTQQLMEGVYGFSLVLQQSSLSGGGRGVFVRDGHVPEGHIVGLYPGTVYLPFEPLFLQSLRNPFVFRCADGWMVDGHHKGISQWLYRSCAFRDLIGQYMSCDLTWLSTNPLNPLSIGQFVNNHTRDIGPNVEYVEMNIPAVFPLSWRRFIPNVFYGSHYHSTEDASTEDARCVFIDSRLMMRTVALVSTRAIMIGEELFSSYLTVITD